MTAIELLNQLNAEDLQRRLDELIEEQKAIVVLLRALRTRERRKATPQKQEVSHA